MPGAFEKAPTRDGSALLLVGGAVIVWAAVSAALVGLALLWSDDGGDGAGIQTASVELREFSIEPGQIAVAPGADLVVRVRNDGDIQHDLTLEGGPGTERLAPGQSAEIDFGTVDPGAVLFCSVPGHREQGMEAEIVVGPPLTAIDQG